MCVLFVCYVYIYMSNTFVRSVLCVFYLYVICILYAYYVCYMYIILGYMYIICIFYGHHMFTICALLSVMYIIGTNSYVYIDIYLYTSITILSKRWLAKAAGAEPFGQMRDEKLHAFLARTRVHKSKRLKTSHVQSSFGS